MQMTILEKATMDEVRTDLFSAATPLTSEASPSRKEGRDKVTGRARYSADIHPAGARHRLSLSVVVTNQEITVEHVALEAAIARGRAVLEQLVEAHRKSAAVLPADVVHVFDLSGRRIR